MNRNFFINIQTKFSTLSPFQKIFALATVGWMVVKTAKILKILSDYSKLDHKTITEKIQGPEPHLFPTFFQNKNGLWIFHRSWLLSNDDSSKKPRGAVVICHGAAEHIQRYEHVAKALNKSGFIVFGIDHQGHGMSGGDRAYVREFEDFVSDFQSFCSNIKKKYPDLPLFALGHSMGGLITCVTAFLYPDLFDGGVVLSAPFFGANRGARPDISIPAVRWVLETVSYYFPKLPVVDINTMGLSTDPGIYYRLIHDPLHHTGKLTIRLGGEILHAAETMRKKFDKIEFPFYIFGGSDDTVCDPEYWEIFYQSTKTPKELKHKFFFKGLLHETMNEVEEEQEKVLQKLTEWLSMRCDTLENE